MAGGKKLIDLTGQRFERLKVLGLAYREWKHSSSGFRYFWHCRCDCGNECIARRDALIIGRVKSCGCWSADRVRTHGESRCGPKPSKEWSVLQGIKTRCLNPASKDYDRYGGRGIRLHQEWADSFEAFLAYVGRAPSADHQIDRINNDGHYEPGNVRWATRKEQQNNTRWAVVSRLNHAEVVEKYLAGQSMRKLAAAYSCSCESIRVIIRRYVPLVGAP